MSNDDGDDDDDGENECKDATDDDRSNNVIDRFDA